MKQKSTIIAVLAIIILIVIGGFLVWKNQQKKNDVKNNQIQQDIKQQSTNQQIVDMSTWKTYRDEKYKFEIKYNFDWEIKDVGIVSAGGAETLFINVDKSRNDIGMYVNRRKSELSPKDWYKKEGTGGITFEKELYINSYPTYYVEFDNDKVYLLKEYSVNHNKKIISFSFQEKYRKFNPKDGTYEETSFSRYLPDFEAMVNSIKFLD